MLVEDILSTHTDNTSILLLNDECSQFIENSGSLPILKALPKSYYDFHKVKVRKHKKTDLVGEMFNKAFVNKLSDFSQRAIITHSSPPIIQETLDLFYVFPIDGYKFIYSTEVTNSTSNYKQLINVLFETFENDIQATEIITDLLKYTYSSSHLIEGIHSQAEIIFYGIPYYYAIRTSVYPIYSDIIQHTHKYYNKKELNYVRH